ncbi:MAG: nucleotidyl transferase AbiEii/AbiGii toxin family protein [Holophagales bacterium]|nr:nucleotidyl transferase AbiEii/AbiGii toxin family protein [Holophagales bacterium]
MDFEVMKKVLEALEKEGVRYVVVGGAALNLHGFVRATEDVDLFVEPDRENLEALKRAFRTVFHDPLIDEISVDELIGDYPAVQYVPPDGGFHIDILTRLGEAFRFEDVESVRMPFGAIEVSVATPRMLYRMKRDTVRPKDRMDAEVLRERFGVKDD